jgi:hypothetical protein
MQNKPGLTDPLAINKEHASDNSSRLTALLFVKPAALAFHECAERLVLLDFKLTLLELICVKA